VVATTTGSVRLPSPSLRESRALRAVLLFTLFHS